MLGDEVREVAEDLILQGLGTDFGFTLGFTGKHQFGTELWLLCKKQTTGDKEWRVRGCGNSR